MGEKKVVRENVDGGLAGLSCREETDHLFFVANFIFLCSFYADNFKYVQVQALGINKCLSNPNPTAFTFVERTKCD
jgi:hypothetical protein